MITFKKLRIEGNVLKLKTIQKSPIAIAPS